ncbi:MAG: hypothetical protein ABIP93_00690 [Gemmatimonadaceae bacterium]
MKITASESIPLIARLRARRLPVITIGVASVLGGCYNYLPVPSEMAQAGAAVRVNLTDAGSIVMTSLVGPRVTSLDGYIDRAGSDSVVLRVRRVTNMRGEENAWAGERLAVPATTIASVQQRRLSTTRTVLAAMIGAGILTAAVVAAGTGGGGEPPVIGGPPPSGQ